MRTVGTILKETREAKLYSLEEVEKATRIRKELLIFLEADDYSKLPPATFVQGFIKNYAKFLGLDSHKLLAVYRREFSEKRHQPYVMDAFTRPPSISKLKLTPGRLLGLIFALIILTFFAYLWVQYRGFSSPPRLVVTSPPEQFTTDNAILAVRGETDPEVKLTVNGQEIMVSTEGEFKEEITLSSPVNKLDVIAVSKFGQKTEVIRTVYLKR